MPEPACPFYGVALMRGVLVPSGGNQCALVTTAHSPCTMEILEAARTLTDSFRRLMKGEIEGESE